MKLHLKSLAAPVAIATLGLSVGLPVASSSFAATAAPVAAPASTTYTATLNKLNHSSASGNVTIVLTGDQAVITEHTEGLAATFDGKPYPHVQHIHIDGQGTCPSPSADLNGDGVVNTTEGKPSYGAIGTSLTLSGDTSPAAGTALNVAPSGAGFDYSRTITLDAKTLASLTGGKAVIVVHGLDPATLSAQAQGEPSDLVPSLPLAATSPALCGALAVQAVSTTSSTPTPTAAAPAPTKARPAFTG